VNLPFRRKAATVPSPTESAEPTTESAAEREASKQHTPAKGRPTPKRSEAQRRRRGAEPPPKNTKEARQRMRAKARAERAEAYAGMRRGDDKYLPPRDRGPVRRLVRDLVDARRNVGSYFLPAALLVIIGSQPVWPPVVQLGANLLWLGLIVTMLLDVILLSRLIRRTVQQRFPDAHERWMSLYFYGVMRSLMFRRMRNPQPQVKAGDPV